MNRMSATSAAILMVATTAILGMAGWMLSRAFTNLQAEATSRLEEIEQVK